MKKTTTDIPTSRSLSNTAFFMIKWISLSGLSGLLSGSASAFFLWALDLVTTSRELNPWLIGLLPVAGLLIGLSYHYLGQRASKGNNLILEEYHRPRQVLPAIMAPLVLLSTLLTHLCGGSAGREGTAVQMGASLSDQLWARLKLKRRERRLLLVAGISGGFASVFGTPLAGAVFGIEVLVMRRLRADLLIPAVLAAFVADATCGAWGVGHTAYEIPFVPAPHPANLGFAFLTGLLAGLGAWLFVKHLAFFGHVFRKYFRYPPLRPLVGGVLLALVVWLWGNTDYLGLGIPQIQAAFKQAPPPYVFFLKILFTAFTLAAGFRGGEVTPLFFIGATLGSALSVLIPLPLALLAGMGFVAVFAGASNTPLACTIMAFELFGWTSSIYMALACLGAWLFAGRKGIYSAQKLHPAKQYIYQKMKKSKA